MPRSFIIVMLSVFLLFGCASTKNMRAVENENQDLRKELEASNNRLKEMEIEIGDLKEKGRTVEQLNQAEIARLKQVNDELKAGLSDEIKKGEIAIEQFKGKLIIRIAEALFFASGSADLVEHGKESLRKIGTALKKIPDKMIRVEGHTDDVPIGEKLRVKYPTNWELSAARAINVVKFLKQEVGVDAYRMSAVAFGPFNPVASNATEAGKAKNRRIEIFVVDKDLDRLKQSR